jgi:NAD(P)-dependent dehydrogenase (short-subunit alcohol dehydrogenase family)
MSPRIDFIRKVALVTGGGTGMGAATAMLLAERGAKVTIVGRREQPLRDTERAIRQAGGTALAVTADVTDPAALQHAVDLTVDHFGALHYAVNNAGSASQNLDVTTLPINAWTSTIATNLSGLFYGLRVELPAIAASGGGAVVNISSVFADRALPDRVAYSAAKHGIRGLTRTVARDWATRGVRVNELQPGVIDTPMIDAGEATEVAGIAATVPAGRVGAPREIATAVAFLLSDDASYITGAHLAVDGGFLA